MYRRYRSNWKQESQEKRPNEIKVCKLRRRARERLIEGIAISGLLEAYYAYSLITRILWILALVVSVCSILQHSILLISFYLNPSSTFEIIHTDNRSIPFPKITVCIPSGINKTWIFERLRFPPKEKRVYDQVSKEGKELMMEEISSMIGNSFRFVVEKFFTAADPRYSLYHHIITETINNITPVVLAKNYTALCEQVISGCFFGRNSFECCQNATQLLDDDGPCFDLGVDRLVISDFPTSLKSPLSFSFDVILDWNHILTFNTGNGFSVFIGEPYSAFAKPVAVPGGTHAMVEVFQPIYHQDKSLCRESAPANEFAEYDPQGDLCRVERYLSDVIEVSLGCRFAYAAVLPNETEICPAVTSLPIKLALSGGFDLEKVARGMEKFLREKMFDIVNSKTRCLPLCNRWQYTAKPSYSELVRDDYAMPVGRNDTGNVTMSRVTVFIGSEFYISRRELDPASFYKTFMLITDVFALYVGGSVVTLAEIVFYTATLCATYIATKRSSTACRISRA